MSNDQTANELAKMIDTFKEEFIKEFAERVKMKTPVRSGALKNGWNIEKESDGYSLTNDQDYAVYVELGTHKQRPAAMIQTTMLETDQIAEIAKQKSGL